MKKGRWCISHDVCVQSEVTNVEDKCPRVGWCMSFHRAISDVHSQFGPFCRNYGFESLQYEDEIGYDTSKYTAELTPGGALKKIPKSATKSKSVKRLYVEECKDTFALDSLALVPLTAFDTRCSSSDGRELDLCSKVRF